MGALLRSVVGGLGNAIAEAGPVVIGLFGLSVGWLVWQWANEPSPGSVRGWFDNLTSINALLSGLSGWGVAFSIATGVKGQVDKAERQ